MTPAEVMAKAVYEAEYYTLWEDFKAENPGTAAERIEDMRVALRALAAMPMTPSMLRELFPRALDGYVQANRAGTESGTCTGARTNHRNLEGA